MSHEDIQDMLELYVDDRLDRSDRKVVEDHLEACAECRAILDHVAPVDLNALGPGGFDEAAMRRTVRRSIFRSAWNTALLLLAAWIVVWFLSALVVQPLLVNRGDRAAAAARTAIDLGTMVNPGATLEDGRIDAGLISKDVSLQFALPVGAGFQTLFSHTLRIGPAGVGDSPIAAPGPDYSEFQGNAGDQLRTLGEGTVATVTVLFENPISLEAAQAIADDPENDFRVVWAGFDAGIGEEEPPAWTWAGVLGYSTCGIETFDPSLLRGTSAGFGNPSTFAPASVDRALQLVIDGLENISARSELTDYVVGRYGGDPDEIGAVIDELVASPRVRALVLTGPSPGIATFLDGLDQAISASTLAVDFYNWTPGICGR